MKRINFLPASVRQAEARNRLSVLAAVSFFVGLAAAGGLWAALHFEGTLTQTRLNDLAQVAAAPTPTPAAGVSAAAALAKSSLVSRIAQVNTLSAAEIDWNKLFTAVNGLVPEDITITSLAAASTPTTLTVTLAGKAPSSYSFALFNESLKARKSAAITSFSVDTFLYNPKDASVTFGMAIIIPPKAVGFTAVK